MRKLILLTILISLVYISACSDTPNVPPPSPSPELTDLVERVAIEKLFADYYAQFGPEGKHDFMSFFTKDGKLEVNGLIASGYDEIKALYVMAGSGGEEEPARAEGEVPEGVSRMMYSNMKIDLLGDSAVVTLLWHSIKSDLLTSQPKVTEYGTERTELVKQEGRWLISRRVIISEGGMPDGELASYPKK